MGVGVSRQKGRLAAGIIAAGVVLGALYGLVRATGSPSDDDRVLAAQHTAQLTQARHAFCNCLQRGDLWSCLASAETGDGIGITDQELLLSKCLER